MNDTERDDLNNRHSSNNENYDKAVLTLLSTGLMFSIAIINFISKEVIYLFLIYLTWSCFILGMSLSLLSFIVANKAVECAIKYDTSNDNKYIKLTDKYTKRTKRLNIFAGVLLIIAFITVAIFAGLNIN